MPHFKAFGMMNLPQMTKTIQVIDVMIISIISIFQSIFIKILMKN